jgi:lipopolysaccharide/colanic/teichoic acid biosynthesis glycosyltransferase
MEYGEWAARVAMLDKRFSLPLLDLGEDTEACLRDPRGSGWVLSRARRCTDLFVSLVAIMFCSLPMLVLAALIRLTSRGPALFTQNRLGKGGHQFRIYKFRSMIVRQKTDAGPDLTVADDGRITAIGRFMRRFKLDELPQFYNVLRGDMSLVGPRPKLPQYASLINAPYRPGLTGPATIAFRHEEKLLRGVDPSQLDAFYEENIKPVKARCDAYYMSKATPASDFRLIAETFLSCFRTAPEPEQMAVIPVAKVSKVLKRFGTAELESD